ncbi:MAG: hypothetical protein GX649_19720 [Chloroflexi bacterium]|nr:hypothetical protein [Chloroflexota bacterium]
MTDRARRNRRIEVRLSAQQVRRLDVLAARDGLDAEEAALRALEVGLNVLSSGGPQDRLRRLEALAHLGAIRGEIENLHGAYGGDLVAEDRAARATRQEAAWPKA